MHPVFPSPDDSDAEDVAWGLTTGAALWKQGERYDAIVWLKRAVDAAAEAGAVTRADELNRAATELLASLSGPTIPLPSGASAPTPPAARPPALPPPTTIAPPLGAMAPTAGALPPPKPPPVRGRAVAPPPPPPSRNTPGSSRREGRHFPPLPPGRPERTPPQSRARLAPGDERDSRPNPALIDQAIREALATPFGHTDPQQMMDPFPRPLTQREPFQTEVDDETDVDQDETIPLPSLPAVLDSSPPSANAASLAPIQSVPISMSPVPSAGPSPMPPPPSVNPVRVQVPAASSPSVAPHRSSPVPAAPPSDFFRSSPPPPASSASVRAGQAASAWGSSPAAPFRQSPLPQLPPSVAPAPISLDALAQLSPSQREGLLRAATIESLGIEEEITVSGLAFVITGQAAIQATVAEASAGVLHAGQLLYAKSPIAETVSLRLVAEAEQTQIALWDAKTAEDALAAAPELLQQLKVASARVQAIVGCSMGAMGDRLDESLRTLAIERLETRILQPHEVLAAAGLPVPGLVIVGVGTVDLDDDGGGHVRDKLMPGDFLFATEVLGAEAAPATARAGAKGAIVLFGARAVAHELLVSCPPLLEIFAGM
ncbi:MAG TPA: hypothetical protein VK540_29565 [Polyangiaceae bacterium]|nr:hypothetical protein [Polyangiaceae bacterium]